jgi:hypothetical protein
MILHEKSHTDHAPAAVLGWALEAFQDKDGFFIATVTYPGPETLLCGLYGPTMGDGPVWESDVFYGKRMGREWFTRMVNKPKRPTKFLTVIGGPYEEHKCVLYTLFPGPSAPKERDDPTLKDEEREGSEQFWSQHALSKES